MQPSEKRSSKGQALKKKTSSKKDAESQKVDPSKPTPSEKANVAQSQSEDAAFQKAQQSHNKFDNGKAKNEISEVTKLIEEDLRLAPTENSKASKTFPKEQSPFSSTKAKNSAEQAFPCSKQSINEDQKAQNSETREATENQLASEEGELDRSSDSADQLRKAFNLDEEIEKPKPEEQKKSAFGLEASHSDRFAKPFQPQANYFHYVSGPLPRTFPDEFEQRALSKNADLLRLKAAQSSSERSISQQTAADGFDKRKSFDAFVIEPNRIVVDGRTTLYIRNIPNKYTKKMMFDTINERFAGTYDFFYLPIDFNYGSNVGYAFINFVDVKYIPDFYDYFQGRKWLHFNSEKICDLKYARIQGRTQCESHFKDSQLMRQPNSIYKPFLGYHNHSGEWNRSEDNDA